MQNLDIYFERMFLPFGGDHVYCILNECLLYANHRLISNCQDNLDSSCTFTLSGFVLLGKLSTQEKSGEAVCQKNRLMSSYSIYQVFSLSL